ncbi:MAG TPA: hypothetical protein IAB44_05170 [Candidatus Limivivens intestinipullorum]|uniref:Phosphohydrolase n=1 Tax=Candidatus Limivivens intestinipullorum TaxID=2840858 RepID=A0A9D1ERG6_9FIRM|nr:hypothetical protein [Candidatus Limivivens intestinipullorum]
MTDYMKTYSGGRFYPADPRIEDLRIEDIAHALSMVCRGNGQVKTFFSVGQHCVHCAREALARGYGRRTALACLLHDASEAYLSDITSPLKKHLAEYRAYEERLMKLVYEKYLGGSLTEEEEIRVKEVDQDMLYYDLLVLLDEDNGREKPVMKSAFSYEWVSFEETQRQYLELFSALTAACRGGEAIKRL